MRPGRPRHHPATAALAVAAVAAAAAPLAAAAGADLRHWAIFGAAAAALTLVLDLLWPRPGQPGTKPHRQHRQRKRAAR